MIWLTWRQHRIEMLILGILFALIAAALINNGLVIGAGYNQVVQGMSAATCQAQQNTGSLCQTLLTNFYDTYEDPNLDLLIPLILPALVGMFLGAPLVARELERGTFRLTWTQSVTRMRWMLVKVGAQLVITLLAFAALSLLVTWYIAQNGSFGGSGWDNFDVMGLVPLAYMAFALALGVTAGTLLRNTVPAMLVTLVCYTAVRVLIGQVVRPIYLPPISATWDPYLTAPQVILASNDWITAKGWVDHAENFVSNNQVGQVCGGPPGMGSGVQLAPWLPSCAHAHGWLLAVSWQPVDRVWLFQGIESAIFFALAAALLVLTYWWIRRRIA